MKNIPCIDADFPLWDWENPVNDNEFADKYFLERAYNALISKDLTILFNMEVWNSMVDWVKKAFDSGKLVWDSKYGDIESVYIKTFGVPEEESEILTAKKFNAITHNVSNQIGTTWKWEYDTSQNGYLGRRNVISGDLLYGWYMVHLFDNLNIMIDIMRGTASYLKDGSSYNSFYTKNNAPLIPLKVGALVYQNSILFELNSDVRVGKTGILERKLPININHTAEFQSVRSAHASAKSIEKSRISADFTDDIRPRIYASTKDKTNVKAEFYANVFVGKMVSNPVVRANLYADLMPEIPIFRTSSVKASSKTKATICLPNPDLFSSSTKSLSKEYANFRISELKHLNANTKSRSYESIELAPLHILGLDYTKPIESKISAKLNLPKSGLLYFMDFSESDQRAELNRLEVSKLFSSEKTDSRIDADTKSVQALKMTGNSIRSDLSISSEVISVKPIYSSGKARSDDKVFGYIISSKPKLAESGIKEASSTSGEQLLLERLLMQSGSSDKSSSKATASRRIAARLKHDGKIASFNYADLTFYKEPGAWRDPERHGSNLRIWNAHPQWQDGTTVHFDSGGIFYEPEQTGSNLYVRSVDSMKEEEVNEDG